MIADLIARVEAATGPDRGLDVDVAEIVLGWECTRHTNSPFVYVSARDSARVFELPNWSASIDAVVELIRREMPGATHGYATEGPGAVFAHVDTTPETGSDASHKTEALALLLAFLRAMQARQTEDATT